MARIRHAASSYRALHAGRRSGRHATTIAVLLALAVGTGMMLLFWAGSADAL